MKSRFNYLWIFLASVIILLVSGVSRSYAVHELFKSIDENADGKINQEEFSEDMKEQAFERLDVNENKTISMQEWEPITDGRNKKKHMELFERIDKDSDKRINFFEFSDYAERNSNIEEAFMGLDKDKNNHLSPDEITVRPLFKMITIKF